MLWKALQQMPTQIKPKMQLWFQGSGRMDGQALANWLQIPLIEIYDNVELYDLINTVKLIFLNILLELIWALVGI